MRYVTRTIVAGFPVATMHQRYIDPSEDQSPLIDAPEPVSWSLLDVEERSAMLMILASREYRLGLCVELAGVVTPQVCERLTQLGWLVRGKVGDNTGCYLVRPLAVANAMRSGLRV